MLLIDGNKSINDLFKAIKTDLKSHYGITFDSLSLKTNDYDIFPANHHVSEVLETKQEVKCFVTNAVVKGVPYVDKLKTFSEKPEKQEKQTRKRKRKDGAEPAPDAGKKKQKTGDAPGKTAMTSAVATTSLSAPTPEEKKATAAKQQAAAAAAQSIFKTMTASTATNPPKSPAKPAKPPTKTPAKTKTPAQAAAAANPPVKQTSTAKSPAKPTTGTPVKAVAPAKAAEDKETAEESSSKRRRKRATTLAGKGTETKDKDADKDGEEASDGEDDGPRRKSRRTSAQADPKAKAVAARKKQVIEKPTEQPSAKKPTKAASVPTVVDHKTALGKILKKNAMPDEASAVKALNVVFEGLSKSAKEKYPVKKMNAMFEEVIGEALTKDAKKMIAKQRKSIAGGN